MQKLQSPSLGTPLNSSGHDQKSNDEPNSSQNDAQHRLSPTIIETLKEALKLSSWLFYTRVVEASTHFINSILLTYYEEEALQKIPLIFGGMVTIDMTFSALLYPIKTHIGNAINENKTGEIGKIVQQAYLIALVTGIPMVVIYLFMAKIILSLVNYPEYESDLQKFFNIYTLYPFFFLHLGVDQRLLATVKHERGLAVLATLQVVVNLAIAFTIISHKTGVANMGYQGLAIALVTANFAAFLATKFYIHYYYRGCFENYNLLERIFNQDWSISKKILRDGILVMFHALNEIGAIAALIILSGRVGKRELGTQTIVTEIMLGAAAPFHSIAQTATILVAKGAADIARYMRAIVAIAAGIGLLIAIGLNSAPELFISIFDNGGKVSDDVVNAVRVVGAFQVLEGIRRGLTGCLYGADTQNAKFVFFSSLFLVSIVGFCLSLLFVHQDMGAVGVNLGIGIGITLQLLALIAKFCRDHCVTSYTTVQSQDLLEQTDRNEGGADFQIMSTGISTRFCGLFSRCCKRGGSDDIQLTIDEDSQEMKCCPC